MLPLLLKNIRLNKDTNLYEAVEAGSKYQIDPSHIDNLGTFLKDNPTLLIAHWYRSLEIHFLFAKK